MEAAGIESVNQRRRWPPYSSAIARKAAEERGRAEAGGAGKPARVRIWRRAGAKPCHGMVAAYVP